MAQTLPRGLETRCRQYAREAHEAMEGYLSRDAGVPPRLQESMLYSLRAGGKRLRPILVMLSCEACGGEAIRALPAAVAVELVHTYSLIHDDLPAMDNDDLRRGQPTNHKVFGEGIALLAGDALLTYAFHILARHVESDVLVRQLVAELATAAGAAGMIGGQVVDLESENSPGTLETLQYIHTRKTAMMFRAAVRMGGVCAGAQGQELDRLGDYGLKLGLAFQITDDLLDVSSTAEELGKRTQKDAAAGKLTYPALVGVEQSQEEAARLIAEAIEALEAFDAKAEPLRQLAQTVLDRRN